MKPHTLLAILFVFSLSPAAHAKTTSTKISKKNPIRKLAAKPIIGEYLEQQDEIPQNVCMLRNVTVEENKISTSYCSGTLISPGRVLTAEHCRHIAIGGKVHCGYQGLDSYDSPKFSEALAINGEPLQISSAHPEHASNGADFMIVDLKTESKITPMAYADDYKKTLESIFSEDLETGIFYLKDDIECRMAGVGTDNEGKMSHMHIAKLQIGEQYRLRYSRGWEKYGMGYVALSNRADFPTMKDVNKAAGILNTNHTGKGDSGGPLYCKIDGTWTVIGTLHGGDDTIDLWSMLGTEAFLLLDKISKIPIPDRTAAIKTLGEK